MAAHHPLAILLASVFSLGADCNPPPSELIEPLTYVSGPASVVVSNERPFATRQRVSWKTSRGGSSIAIVTSGEGNFALRTAARYSDGEEDSRSIEQTPDGGVQDAPVSTRSLAFRHELSCKRDQCAHEVIIDTTLSTNGPPINVKWGLSLLIEALDYEMGLSDLTVEPLDAST